MIHSDAIAEHGCGMERRPSLDLSQSFRPTFVAITLQSFLKAHDLSGLPWSIEPVPPFQARVTDQNLRQQGRVIKGDIEPAPPQRGIS